MSDLVAFLNARLDEDEAWANDMLLVSGPLGQGGLHRRVLREVEAKRRILRRYKDYIGLAAESDPGQESSRRTVRDTFYVAALDLAAVYSDHPDYQQEWA